MELYQLRTFAAVAEESHLTRAAERLHLSQPAVSGHIKALEGELGVRLFARASTGMELTAAGGELLKHARRALSAADDVKRAAQRMHGDITGMLRVGTVADPESNRLGELLSLARDTHPRLKLELHHAMSGAALAEVQSGGLDASFFFGDVAGSEFFSLPLRRLIYRVAAPAAWADRVDGAQWDAISRLPWIGTPDISTHTRLVGDLFAQRSLPPPRASVQADDESVITNLVVSGLGVGLIRDDVARRLERAGDVVIWTRAAIDTALWFVCSASRTDEPIIAALLDIVRKTWKIDGAPVEEALAGSSA
ncbi:MAG: LysR family transcriptional regulator [Pseudomonadota bacterium]|nr:LysR family transcriptional regulator [Burkholderiaceae bacterium]MDQ3445632.1 LysR family transcriptional regulator [Pseudomonadota bacterium]